MGLYDRLVSQYLHAIRIVEAGEGEDEEDNYPVVRVSLELPTELLEAYQRLKGEEADLYTFLEDTRLLEKLGSLEKAQSCDDPDLDLEVIVQFLADNIKIKGTRVSEIMFRLGITEMSEDECEDLDDELSEDPLERS